MNNKILNYTITEIDYKLPEELFDTIEKGYMPSLLTGNGPDDISKNSIIGLNPVKDITLVNKETLWEDLRRLTDSTNFHELPFPINRIGAIGYISYEALHTIEKIEKLTNPHFDFPLVNWTIYKTYYYFDNPNSKLWSIELDFGKNNTIEGNRKEDKNYSVTNLKPDFTPEEYKRNVETIRNKIFDGEVYEVNLTQGIVGDFKGSPYTLFKKLYKNNSAPYSAYMERNGYTVICNSPELFLSCSKNRVETRPIKGTAPRSEDPIEDNKLKNALLNSQKNQAELYMIVDLMRNDLSKVCRVNSVKVETPKRVETYRNVHHLVSIIEGTLLDDADYIDLFKATFPGGSITGCPKVRCMEITEEIERSSRNLYTGTIFVMNREFLTSNIVIRSCVVKDRKIVLNSGGAITIDSDPEEEYRESLIKLESLFSAVNNKIL